MRPIRDVLRIVDDQFEHAIANHAVTCTVGCSGCCHQVVQVMLAEAVALLDAYPWIAAQREALERETDFLLRPETDMDNAYGRPCVLLRDKLCTVYADRPIACRGYYVISDPALCHAPVGARVQAIDTGTIQALAMRDIWERGDAPLLMAPIPIALLGAISLRKGAAAWRSFLTRLGIKKLPPGEVIQCRIPDGPSIAEWRNDNQQRVRSMGRVAL